MKKRVVLVFLLFALVVASAVFAQWWEPGPPPGISITHSDRAVTVRNDSDESRTLDLMIVFTDNENNTTSDTWYVTVGPNRYQRKDFASEMQRAYGYLTRDRGIRIQTVRIAGWS